jgi:predicted molibdopterin-dependent oxidoreductase YjgC
VRTRRRRSRRDEDPLSWTATRLGADGGRGRPVRLFADGREIPAFSGESVATALLAAGIRVARETARGHEPRGLFCGMGVCFDCVVTVDGVPNVRACLAPVAEGMRVVTRRT